MLSTVVVKFALCDADDAVSHLLRNQAVVVPDDAHHGNVDIGENSVGVRTIAMTPMTRIRMAITTNV